jgi:glycosyltransferase involved in cell wall biosynthesis
MKKVSVCMLAYNTSCFIEQAIESVLAQKTDFDFELVIADNKSADATRQIITDYQLKYPAIIKPVFNPVNLGMSANFITAFKNCSAEYIAILDSDDYWIDPLKLQKQADFLDANNDYGAVYSDCTIVNDANKETEWEEMNDYRKQFGSGNLFFKLLEETAFIPNLTACFRKELINEELEKKDLWFFEDWWLWMRVSIKSKIFYMDSCTACYRLHDGNNSQARLKNKSSRKEYQKKSYMIFYDNIIYYAAVNKNKLNRAELKLLYKRILMLLYRAQGTLKMKFKLAPLLIKYYPGTGTFFSLFNEKLKRVKIFILAFPKFLLSGIDSFCLAFFENTLPAGLL